MLSEYLQAALSRAEYKQLEDTTWFAEIPGFPGVWANSGTVETCRSELREVLEEWLILNPHGGQEIGAGLLSEILRQAGIEKSVWGKL